MTLLHNKEKLKDRRRELRRKSTVEEEIIWNELRDRKLGYKFKRQHSIGGYILDFYCSEQKLVIEIDGKSHSQSEAKEYDKIRDTYFNELGYTTIRFLNKDIKNNLERVLNEITDYLNPSP
jgi:very-short-patch-repair endonuclease